MEELGNEDYGLFPNFQLDLNNFCQQEQDLLDQDTPLREAVKNGNLETVKELIRIDHSEINKPNCKGWTLLHEAAVNDDLIDIVKFLLSAGAEADYKTENGVSPLYVASKYGSVAIAQMLIDAGANVNNKFVFDYDYGRFIHFNFTALHIACTRRNEGIVKVLIDNNADVNAKDDLKRTPIHYAIDNANVGGVRMLIEAGADLMLKDIHGCSPLHYASMLGDREIFNMMKFLFSNESIINDKTPEGSTSLMLACQFKHYFVAEELIKLGADTTIVDYAGLLAIHMAALAGFKIFKLLLLNTPERALEKYASYGCNLKKWRSLPCVIIESQCLDSLILLYKSDLSEAILKCPDLINGHLVSPIGYLLMYNSQWFTKEDKLKFLEFLLSYDFLVDPNYETEDESLKVDYNHRLWEKPLNILMKDPPKLSLSERSAKITTSIEAIVQTHSHLHRGCYCELFLSMILSKKKSSLSYLPCSSFRQLSLFWQSALQGFLPALTLLRYSVYIEPDDIMDMFLKQISNQRYTWTDYEKAVTEFLLEVCVTNFMPTFTKMRNSLTEPTNDGERRRYDEFLSIYQMAKSKASVVSLKRLSRFAFRKYIRQQAYVSLESIQGVLNKIVVPPSIIRYILYEEDFFNC